MKITDPKILRELYDIEAEGKLLIGYRFKGCLARKKRGNPARGRKLLAEIRQRIASRTKVTTSK